MKKEEFNDWVMSNPRTVRKEELADFIAYAKKRYEEVADLMGEPVVNMTHGFEDKEEFLYEVESYILDCEEALMLYQEYAQREQKQ